MCIWLILLYHHKIRSINLSSCCHIFRGCVPEVVVTSNAASFIYIPGKLGLYLLLWCVQIIEYNLAQGSYCFFAYYTTSLSSLCRSIWRCWTSKMLIRYILFRVCVLVNSPIYLSCIFHMGLCVFSSPISFMTIVRIHILYLIIIIKSEVWPICHCLRLGHETMTCAVCLSILL